MSTELYLAQFNWSLQYKSGLPLRFDKLLEECSRCCTRQPVIIHIFTRNVETRKGWQV